MSEKEEPIVEPVKTAPDPKRKSKEGPPDPFVIRPWFTQPGRIATGLTKMVVAYGVQKIVVGGIKRFIKNRRG